MIEVKKPVDGRTSGPHYFFCLTKVTMTMVTVACLRRAAVARSASRWPDRRWASSVTSLYSTETNALIGRTLYRQLVRWCKSVGGTDIPLSHLIPPVSLTVPRIDGEALKRLASLPTDERGEYVVSDDIDGDGSDLVRVHRMLPRDAIVGDNLLICPVRRAVPDLVGLIRAVYRINSPGFAAGAKSGDSEADTADGDVNVTQERVNLGFEATRSLNELSEAINRMKQQRIEHTDRSGVQFNVGQVVQHKGDRWRGIVVGWKRGPPPPVQQGPGGGSSLTTKDYGAATEKETNNSAATTIRYDVIIDTGDAHLLGGKRNVDAETGFPLVNQTDLQAVDDPLLLRIRSHWTRNKIDRFDSQTHRFVPNGYVQYEYPADYVAIDASSDDGSSSETDKIANGVIEAVRTFSGHLHKRILEITPSPEARSGTVISSLRERLSAMSSGTLTDPSDVVSLIADDMSLPSLATMHLQQLLEIGMELSEMSWQRRIALKDRERIRFPLGTIVRHKKYGFRGVVVAWDPTPSVDVTRWDGLQDIENPMDQPFYHVIPDKNDCIKAFGGERSFRYVIDGNLEPCPSNQSIIDVPNLDTDEWILNTGTEEWRYDPPDLLKFKYAESMGADEDSIVSAVEFVKKEFSSLYLASRDGDLSESNPLYSMASALSLEKLLELLQELDNLNDTVTIEETLKEMFKAHRCEETRRRLDDGLADLLRGKKEDALQRFSELVQDEPTYAEAHNKKSTCHYMLGQTAESIEAAQASLHLAPLNFQALSGLGLCQYESREYQLAADSFRKSLLINPWSQISSKYVACVDLLAKIDTAKDQTYPWDGDQGENERRP